MVFRTASAIAALMVWLGASGGKASAQYYPPAQAYPPPQTYPPQDYYPRQGYRALPPVVDDDADDDLIYDLQGRPLLPGAQNNKPPPRGARYGREGLPPPGTYRDGPQQGYRDLPPPDGEDYEPAVPGTRPYYGVPDRIPPGPADSAKQDAIRLDAMRSRQRPGPDDPRQQGYRDLPPQGSEDYEPYYGVPDGIPPSPAGSAKQDAILQEAMRSRAPISPGQIGPGPDDPRVTGSIGGGGDSRNMAAFPPDVRPETGPKKELAPQFRRTVVDYHTKESAGTIIVDTPNTYLYLVLGNGKALRYGIGVGREGFTWSGVQQVTKMSEWPDWNPPEEMIVRQPYLPRFMAGGETNPLGARALYLGKTIYRIHGTNQPSTIGTFVSSGCIRLTNEDVIDLYTRVKVGTRVVVLPGRPPATEAATPGAPPAGASVRGGSVTTAPLGPPPFVMAR
jgi:lipoprotein-anchoring transpeptidase ErfK/SrfK